MTVRPSTYVALSAFGGALSFVTSATGWWLAAFFLMPLFVSVARELPLKPWQQGLWWGLIFFGVQSSWIFFLMVHKTGCPSLGLFVASFFVIYCSLYAALWFAIATNIARWQDTAQWRITSFGLVGILIFYWLERGAFFITGQFDGYPVMQPLLPLAEKPSLLYFLPIIGSVGLLAALFLMQGALALWWTYHRLYGFVALLGALPFVFGILLWQSNAKPSYGSTIWYIAPKSSANGLYAQANEIARELERVHARYPAIKIFVMPESMLSVSLTDYPQILTAWDEALGHAPAVLILGAQLQNAGCWFNTLYVIKQGKIVAMHRKCHCIPFVEYMPPPWCCVDPLRNLFLGDCYAFSPVGNERITINLFDGLSVVPYICSELYFCYQPPQCSSEYPVLCIVNDSWFVPYVRRLLLLSARCKAMAWQRDILYVGHFGGSCITRAGNQYQLNTGT